MLEQIVYFVLNVLFQATTRRLIMRVFAYNYIAHITILGAVSMATEIADPLSALCNPRRDSNEA